MFAPTAVAGTKFCPYFFKNIFIIHCFLLLRIYTAADEDVYKVVLCSLCDDDLKTGP